jgi:hypothetical protein
MATGFDRHDWRSFFVLFLYESYQEYTEPYTPIARWQFFYQIRDKALLILIVKIGHRSEVYRRI